jgi:hypothetical protein
MTPSGIALAVAMVVLAIAAFTVGRGKSPTQRRLWLVAKIVAGVAIAVALYDVLLD